MKYKALYRKLDGTLDKIQRTSDPVETLASAVRLLVDGFRADLGLAGARIYVRRGAYYELQTAYPDGTAPLGFRISASYAPVKELLRSGFVLRDVRDPGVDAALESAVGVDTFAAIALGDRAGQIVAFTLRPGFDRQEVMHTLNTIRHVLNLKLRQQHFEGRLAQAREIQLSLLPRTPPEFGDVDLWAHTVPAEEVGGDLYDFLPVSERSLGLAVADASGHGLPAALQARDAIIGLRMGVEERWRITATVEKLNRVVARSALSSKFISLFYAEIERNGTLVYCNAGHPAPLLSQECGITELSRGGMVLGPNPGARYERGYAVLGRGDVLLAYTDGITEAEGDDGDAFGVERLRSLLTSTRWRSARALVEAVFREVRRFSGTDAPADDQTVLALVCRRRRRA